MKKQWLLILICFYAFAKAGLAQTYPYTVEDVIGIYIKDFRKMAQEKQNGAVDVVDWSVSLMPDGRFEYHNFRQLKGQEEEHWYAQGNWKLEGKVILFSSTTEDIDKKYAINLNGSKARFFKKSPRNTSSEKLPTYIRFFKSDYTIAKSLMLHKTNE